MAEGSGTSRHRGEEVPSNPPLPFSDGGQRPRPGYELGQVLAPPCEGHMFFHQLLALGTPNRPALGERSPLPGKAGVEKPVSWVRSPALEAPVDSSEGHLRKPNQSPRGSPALAREPRPRPGP